ncbi:hypothetical protein [Bradyrhizobium sp. AZCC 2230]|uniref:hypothetical protein n=1 Tax=Bradyrhizobium sp. AZCC 2230 TaxID=3117021 RepID=UPI002FF414DD
MPKADSDDSTTPSGDTSPSKKKVASSRKTPPNEPTGDRPANQKETSMSKSASAQRVHALQPLQQPTTQRRPVRTARSRGTVLDDPIIHALNEYRNVMSRVIQERGDGSKSLKDPSDATINDDLEALERIKNTVPRTLYGVMHLAQFILCTIQDEVGIDEYQAALQNNLIRAIEKISGRAAPEVPPYLY